MQKRSFESKIILFGKGSRSIKLSPNTQRIRFKEGVGFEEESGSPETTNKESINQKYGTPDFNSEDMKFDSLEG